MLSNQNEFLNLDDNYGKDIPRIRVIVRSRPMSKKETLRGDLCIVDLKSSSQLVVKELKYFFYASIN